MSGVVTGQVFTDKELRLLMEWYEQLGLAGLSTVEDANLVEKIRNDYNNAIACRV